jgi:hypothetical protein
VLADGRLTGSQSPGQRRYASESSSAPNKTKPPARLPGAGGPKRRQAPSQPAERPSYKLVRVCGFLKERCGVLRCGRRRGYVGTPRPRTRRCLRGTFVFTSRGRRCVRGGACQPYEDVTIWTLHDYRLTQLRTHGFGPFHVETHVKTRVTFGSYGPDFDGPIRCGAAGQF